MYTILDMETVLTALVPSVEKKNGKQYVTLTIDRSTVNSGAVNALTKNKKKHRN